MRQMDGLQCLQNLPLTNGQGTPLGLSRCADKAPQTLRPKEARTPSEKPRKYGDIGVGPHREEKRNALRADRPLRMREDGWRAGRRAKKFPLPVSNGNLINRISMCIIQLWHPQLLPQRQVLRLRELQLQLLQQQVQPWQQTCVNDVYG